MSPRDQQILSGLTPEQQRILISLLEQTGGQTYSGLPKGVTTAGLNRQFDPRSLFLGGGVSAETIHQGIADAYTSLLNEYNTKIAGPNAYKTSDAFLGAIPSKWTGTDAVSVWMGEAFDNILQGNATVDGIKITIGDTPKEVQDAVSSGVLPIYKDLEDFADTADTYNSAVAEQEYNRGQNAGTVGPAPTMTDARRKYYEDAGAPEMALLPDPSAQYEFDPSTFIDNSTGQYSEAQRILADRQDALSRMMSGPQMSSAIEQNKLAESYRMKALQAEAQKYAEAQTSGMDTTESAWDATKNIFGSALRTAGVAGAAGAAAGFLGGPLAPLSVPLTAAGAALTFGVPKLASNVMNWFQGDYNEDLRAKQDAATKLAYTKQLAKLQSGYTPLTDQQALLRYSPDAALANSQFLRAQSDVSKMDIRGQLLSQLLTAKISAAGRSPYADAVNAALRNS